MGNRRYVRGFVTVGIALSAAAASVGWVTTGQAGPPTSEVSAASSSGSSTPGVRVRRPATERDVPTGNFVSVNAEVQAAPGRSVESCRIRWGNGYVSGNLQYDTQCVGGASYNVAGKYRIRVEATDDKGNVGSDSVSIRVRHKKTVVEGDGKVADAGGSGGLYSFRTSARLAKDGPVGELEINGTRGRFVARRIDTITVPQGAVWWSGRGTWKGSAGYTFDAAASSPRGRKGSDRVDVTVRSPDGSTVLSVIGYRPQVRLELRR